MKSWKLAVLALAVSLSLGACKEEVPAGYPFQRVITNAEGKQIEVTVVGRTQGALLFTRAGEDQRYDYPIADLSSKDRRFAESLPIHAPREESAWIQSKREELRRIEERIASYRQQIRDAPGSDMRVRSYRREIAKLEDAKTKLEQSIKEDLAAGR